MCGHTLVIAEQEGRLQEQINLAKRVSPDKIMDVNLASQGGCKPNQRKKRHAKNNSHLKPIVGERTRKVF